MPEEIISTAAHLSPGQKASIVKIEGRGYLRKRLLDMGVVPGSTIQMVRRAPLGDPIDVKIKGYHLSLRKSEASYIIVKRLA
ncbi:MAG: ferrous iron transport protein A [Candidatus Omnitrophica bacterium]|nr:ferrous iron transport protein A [Candidatus Omnitrophota bacterium]